MGSSPTGSILQVQHALKRERTGQLELLLLTTFWVSVPLYWQLPSPLTKNTHASPQFDSQNKLYFIYMSTCGLVAMTSASHAEGHQFDPGQVYPCLCATPADRHPHYPSFTHGTGQSCVCHPTEQSTQSVDTKDCRF